jgi:hypothetical protein
LPTSGRESVEGIPDMERTSFPKDAQFGGVTRHVLSPRPSHAVPRLISRTVSVPFARRGVREWDRILVRVGTTGIPPCIAANLFGTPGKSGRAVFAFHSPGPPLRSFPKKCRALFCTPWPQGSQQNPEQSLIRPCGLITAGHLRRPTFPVVAYLRQNPHKPAMLGR